MAIQNPELALHRVSIDYEFSLYRRLIGSIDGHIQSDLKTFVADLNDKADEIEDAEVREDFFVWHFDDFQNFEYLRQLALRSMFVASVSLFEYRFLKICLAAQRKSSNPIGITDLGEFSLRRAKLYLNKLGVEVPTQGVEWNDSKRFYRLRNAIVHKGGFIPASGDLVDFARQKGITYEPFGSGPTKKQSTDSEIRLELTREFCEEALDTLKRLLFQVTHAVVNPSET